MNPTHVIIKLDSPVGPKDAELLAEHVKQSLAFADVESAEPGYVDGAGRVVLEKTDDPLELRRARTTEHQAWLALVSEMVKSRVGDINAGGDDERLHDAICAWGEELAQLRMADPDPAHAERALSERREKYLGVDV